MIPQRPTQQDQFVYYDNAYRNEAGCCVACAIASAKEIQEIRSGRGTILNSVGWFFGATANGDNGTTYATALDFLRDKGMMPYSNVIQAPHVTRYPDNYFYSDTDGYSGARTLYENNQNMQFALPQKIKSWKVITGNINESFHWQDVINAIQKTSGNTSSVVLMDIGCETSIYDVGTDGIMKDCSGNFADGHIMVVLGWKTIGGKLYWICQNSWGASRGDNGLFYIPFRNVFCHPGTNFSISTTGIHAFYELVDDPNAPIPVLEPWDWSKSNGQASAAQTEAAYKAVTEHGCTNKFNYLVWNDMVNKVKNILNKNGWAWNNSFASYTATLMSSSDRTLTAARFNALRYNIGSHYSTGINTVYSGDTVYGWYFTTLTDRMNKMI